MIFRCVLLLFLVCTAIPLPAAGKEAEPGAAAVPLADLVRIWNDHGMPLPPADAPLVRFTTGSRRVADDGVETPLFSIGFQLEAGVESRTRTILAGVTKIEQNELKGAVCQPIRPEAGVLLGKHIYEGVWDEGPNSLIGTAIQCEARGWSGFAEKLFGIALTKDSRSRFSPTDQHAGRAAMAALYATVWNHFQHEAMRPGCDRPGLAAKMKRLLDSGHDLPRNGGRWLYDALHAAAQPGKGLPSTPEAAIDRLIDSGKGAGAMGGGQDPGKDDPYYQLEALGFAAVPALLESIDDPRLTCSMTAGFNNFPSWPRRVGDLVSDLLQELSGGELGADGLDRQKGAGVAAESAREWWTKAQKRGEEPWFVQGAVAKANNDNPFPNDCHLRNLGLGGFPPGCQTGGNRAEDGTHQPVGLQLRR